MENLVAFRVEKNVPHVAEVVLVGPGKGNAMGPEFWSGMSARFSRARQERRRSRDHRARLRDEFFLWSRHANDGSDATQHHGWRVAREGAHEALRARVGDARPGSMPLRRARSPSSQPSSGRCIGGGVDLISACDVRLATTDAVFSVREAKVAMVADLGSLQRLPRIIGRCAHEDVGAHGR